MSALFISVLRQALKTFDRSNKATFSANFTLLKQLAQQLTYRDIHLNQDILSDAAFERPNRAPCNFVHIFENEIVSMSVFVVRAGYTMPLHDHPMMYGVLRGIYGQLHVQSYTQQLSPNEPLVYDRNKRKVYVRADEPRIVSPETECAILTPIERNFHEITALNGVAAFFDILSPPYDAEMPVYGTRKCRFYHAHLPTIKYAAEKIENQNPILCLERTPAPAYYTCNTTETPEAVVVATNMQWSREVAHRGR